MRSSIAIALLLLSAGAAAEAQEDTDRYLLLATERTGTMQQEINDAAARGFRVVAASPSDGSEAIVLLEQAEDKHQYLLVATTRTGTLQREITRCGRGWLSHRPARGGAQGGRVAGAAGEGR